MFRIIKDLEVARALAAEGLLWWVSRGDGGEGIMIITCPYGTGGVLKTHVDAGILGIRLDA